MGEARLCKMEKEMVGEREEEGSGVLRTPTTRDPGIWGFQTAGKHALRLLDVVCWIARCGGQILSLQTTRTTKSAPPCSPSLVILGLCACGDTEFSR